LFDTHKAFHGFMLKRQGKNVVSPWLTKSVAMR